MFPTFDPPKAFADKRVPITRDQGALVGPGLAYTTLAENEDPKELTVTVHAISLADGTERWKAPTPIQYHSGLISRRSDCLRLTTGPGPLRLVWAGVRRIEGAGTQQDRFELSVGALDAATGQPRWTGDVRVNNLYAAVVTPGLAHLVENAIFGSKALLVSTTDGTVKATLPDSKECSPATPDIVVCRGYDQVMALNLSGTVLWSLPDEPAGRISPSVTAVYGGLVYGQANGGIILDARTGKDLVTGPEVGPGRHRARLRHQPGQYRRPHQPSRHRLTGCRYPS